MTTDQMSKALASVGAEFFLSSAKFRHDSDPFGAVPAYHVYPDASNHTSESIVRLISQTELLDWVNTAKAVKQATSDQAASQLWEAYHARSYGRYASQI